MDARQPAKRPVTVLAGPYGHPFHPILVTVPIGEYLGGKLAYRYGVRVADEHTQAEGFVTSAAVDAGLTSRHADQS
jgi:hypothetical protein